jgi:hypothetical protein
MRTPLISGLQSGREGAEIEEHGITQVLDRGTAGGNEGKLQSSYDNIG